MIDISGTKIRVVVGKVNKEIDLLEMFSIDEGELTKEYSQQSALYAYISTLVAEAERYMAIAEMARDQEYASSDAFYREALAARKEKVTEAMVKQSIMSDEDYSKKANEAIDKKYHFKVLKAVADALEQRANMLVSLGAYLRHEMDMTGMNIRRREMDESVNALKSTIKKVHREDDESAGK